MVTPCLPRGDIGMQGCRDRGWSPWCQTHSRPCGPCGSPGGHREHGGVGALELGDPAQALERGQGLSNTSTTHSMGVLSWVARGHLRFWCHGAPTAPASLYPPVLMLWDRGPVPGWGPCSSMVLSQCGGTVPIMAQLRAGSTPHQAGTWGSSKTLGLGLTALGQDWGARLSLPSCCTREQWRTGDTGQQS